MSQYRMDHLKERWDRLEVRLLGARSRRLSTIRKRWRAKFGGKRCLILGSAPGAILPARFDACLCVNGSPWMAKQAGLAAPDLTVVARYAIDSKTPKSRSTLAALRDLATDELVYVPLGQSEAEARDIFGNAAFGFEALTLATRRERAIIIADASNSDIGSGDRDERVSNGIFAAAIAIWSGASELVLAGFSLKGGHGYIEGLTQRLHVDTDLAFFRMGDDIHRRTGCRVVTTSGEIHQAAGLPLVT